ncbi:reverse transcriptase [Elysia marginata]|uniref:Reverse transcriptase n=1 Tax=Elysia marginata TaxID=1093978 RepID=A0AAV4FIB6_9GAST|nr:reverse transcriptase [Elysia marginata]
MEQHKKYFKNVCREKLGRKRKRKPKPYTSKEVIELTAKKSLARRTGKQNEYQALEREIESKFRRDKKHLLEEEYARINERNEKRKSRELYEQIKVVKKSCFRVRNQCISDKNWGTLLFSTVILPSPENNYKYPITEPEEILQRWNEYDKALFSEETPNNNGNSEPTLTVSLDAEDADIEPEPLRGKQTINTRKLKYAGHALRNPRTTLMKTECEGKLEGTRNKARPPASLVSNLVTVSGMSLHKMVWASQDRDGWMKIVHMSAAANTASGDAGS